MPSDCFEPADDFEEAVELAYTLSAAVSIQAQAAA